jgi:hypothetical protein
MIIMINDSISKWIFKILYTFTWNTGKWGGGGWEIAFFAFSWHLNPNPSTLP